MHSTEQVCLLTRLQSHHFPTLPHGSVCTKPCCGGQVGKPFMKQRGFHIAEHSSHSTRPDDALQGSSQTSSKLAEGLQGLMDMCNAGSLMTTPAPAMVTALTVVLTVALLQQSYMIHLPSNCPSPDMSEWGVPSPVALLATELALLTFPSGLCKVPAINSPDQVLFSISSSSTVCMGKLIINSESKMLRRSTVSFFCRHPVVKWRWWVPLMLPLVSGALSSQLYEASRHARSAVIAVHQYVPAAPSPWPCFTAHAQNLIWHTDVQTTNLYAHFATRVASQCLSPGVV